MESRGSDKEHLCPLTGDVGDETFNRMFEPFPAAGEAPEIELESGKGEDQEDQHERQAEEAWGTRRVRGPPASLQHKSEQSTRPRTCPSETGARTACRAAPRTPHTNQVTTRSLRYRRSSWATRLLGGPVKLGISQCW